MVGDHTGRPGTASPTFLQHEDSADTPAGCAYHGRTCTGALVNFNAPVPLVDTEGGDTATAIGYGFGPTPRNTTTNATGLQLLGTGGWAVPLSQAPGLPTAFLVLSFHRSCVTLATTLRG